MALTVEAIRVAQSDEELLELLYSEHERVLPEVSDRDLVARVSHIAPGLRAMAGTWILSASMALDSLEDHFSNHCDLEIYAETLAGLRELGAVEEAELFEEAFRILAPHWLEFEQVIASPDEDPSLWLLEMDLEDEFKPLNKRMWELLEGKKHGLMQYWVDYARRYPERCVGSIATARQHSEGPPLRSPYPTGSPVLIEPVLLGSSAQSVRWGRGKRAQSGRAGFRVSKDAIELPKATPTPHFPYGFLTGPELQNRPSLLITYGFTGLYPKGGEGGI